ncbi:hypothetical protein LWC35_03250 [Pseudonocardia kujensis]|uniref:hypothetical protein n=1 Tax=Pseudonocardia kujensis TaxID=1128675 RepID=UPI001E4F7DB0|nr:hypothetical protein [Pseudonocardia kujensis]MCE0761933.1 hypothetical protein [Pseudonocardia kujensis]
MDRTSMASRAACKAMTDTVLPALLATGDSQAIEQAHLVRDFLGYAADRVDLVDRRNRFHLRAALATAEAVEAQGVLPAGEPVCAAVAEGRRVLADPDADDRAVVAALAALDGALCGLVRRLGTMAPDVRAAVERAVVAGSRPRLAADRSWVAPLGFDPEPATIPDLLGALDGRREDA